MCSCVGHGQRLCSYFFFFYWCCNVAGALYVNCVCSVGIVICGSWELSWSGCNSLLLKMMIM
jgi:hypothetical protein